MSDSAVSKRKNYICSVAYRLALYLSLTFICLSFYGQGQDLIVRIYGDTIHAQIDQEDERFIYYRTKSTHRSETEIISRKEVREIIYGIDDSAKRKIAPRKVGKEFRTFQLSVRAGYSWILSGDDLYGDDFQMVYDEMRGGAFVDARLNYFITEDVGLGAVYSNSSYQTDSEVPILVSLPSGTDLTGEIAHSRTLRYYAFNLALIAHKSSNVNVQIDLGFGLLAFEDNAEFIGAYTLSSSTLGGHVSASLQIGLGEGFYLPAMISVKGFRLNSFEFDPSPEMNPELAVGLQSIYNNLQGGINANRIQIGLGLGFAF